MAPASSNFFFNSSASALAMPGFIKVGAFSTNSLASLRPRLVITLISFISTIFFAASNEANFKSTFAF